MSIKYLFLTGGLGNQLFQYSAVSSYAKQGKIVIDVVNGNPRTSSSGTADLLDFQLDNNIIFHNRTMFRFTRKAVGYSLRSSLSPTKVENNGLWRVATNIITSFLLTMHYRRIIRIQALRDLGDDINFVEPTSSNYFVGYFQSVRWASKLHSSSSEVLSLKNSSELVSEYRILSKVEIPLVVHVRLGDYAAEGGFGIPGYDYYSEAIRHQLLEKKFRKIWLFSDEPEKAVGLIPKNLELEVRVIANPQLTSSETLEIMRFGYGYVIANSTFSWWGAYLTYNENSRVIYPYPWFKNQPSPRNLMPKGWEGINAKF